MSPKVLNTCKTNPECVFPSLGWTIKEFGSVSLNKGEIFCKATNIFFYKCRNLKSALYDCIEEAFDDRRK